MNPETDLASRKASSIKKIIQWILNRFQKKKMNIFDLGCGLGLYSEILEENGHHVTGIDFSKSSIVYARNQAKVKNLDIKYLHQNYLELDHENKYDLVLFIYTDFGLLLPDERDILLQNIHRALKPGGVFIFDVLNDKHINEKISSKSWDME